MSPQRREDLLEVSTKALEYYILSQTTESLKGYQWQQESYFQWPGFVYIILEAHHRFEDPAVHNLWSLIGRIYAIHPNLLVALNRPDIATIVRITLVAWHRRYTYVQQQRQLQQHHQGHNKTSNSNSNINSISSPNFPFIASDELNPPPWILELRRKMDLPDLDAVDNNTMQSNPNSNSNPSPNLNSIPTHPSTSTMTTTTTTASTPTTAAPTHRPQPHDPPSTSTSTGTNTSDAMHLLLPPDFDFDVIDWSMWDDKHFDAMMADWE